MLMYLSIHNVLPRYLLKILVKRQLCHINYMYIASSIIINDHSTIQHSDKRHKYFSYKCRC